MDTQLLSIGARDAEPLRLVWTNEHAESFRYIPEQFTVTVDVDRWRETEPALDAVQLQVPPTWVSELPTWRPVDDHTPQVEWRVSGREEPRWFSQVIGVSAYANGQEIARVEQSVPIEIVAVSQFDPARHGFQRPNSVEGWGVVQPRRDLFERTYGFAFFRDRFFTGLYRSIVFLGAKQGRYQGGICTGMARSALERSLSPNHDEPSLDEILLWHGRQLTDRALLASAGWLFAPSPRRAFATFRRELLSSGVSKRCFDIAVPRPWRRDIFSALQQQGHTVVPFALRQISSDRAIVSVYDPNDPEKSMQRAATVTFLLDTNRYRYRPLENLDLEKTTVIAANQASYRDGRSAMLASLADATLGVEESFRSGLRSITSSAARLRLERLSRLWDALLS